MTRLAKHSVTGLCAALLLLCCASRGAESQAAATAAAKPQLAPAEHNDQNKAVLEDTEHLLKLARELKANVDKTRRDELSLQVVREADEIEKLARSVKARIH